MLHIPNRYTPSLPEPAPDTEDVGHYAPPHAGAHPHHPYARTWETLPAAHHEPQAPEIAAPAPEMAEPMRMPRVAQRPWNGQVAHAPRYAPQTPPYPDPAAHGWPQHQLVVPHRSGVQPAPAQPSGPMHGYAHPASRPAAQGYAQPPSTSVAAVPARQPAQPQVEEPVPLPEARVQYRGGRVLAKVVGIAGWLFAAAGIVSPAPVLAGFFPVPVSVGSMLTVAGVLLGGGLLAVLASHVSIALFDQADALRELAALERVKLSSERR